MIVCIAGTDCHVYRTPGDPVFRPNWGNRSWIAPGWYAAESRLLYHVRRILRGRGYDVIKKRMWRDGHMFGSTETQYIRTRNIKSPSFQIIHMQYATENAPELFNVVGYVRLGVDYGLDEKSFGALSRESMRYVREIERKQRCYEVSWDGEAMIDGMMESCRIRRGFNDLQDAKAEYAARSSEEFGLRLMNVRSGSPMTTRV